MIFDWQSGRGPIDRVTASAAHIDAFRDLPRGTAKADCVAKDEMQTAMS
jgi:hypothetical protein